ncbi:Callose synthase 3, partial [Ananas comosus]
PRLFVGRGMHESSFSLLMYTLFWFVLILTKLAFSYYVEIKPLVGPTQDIMRIPITTFQWHEFSLENNVGVVIALWAPIILVCFLHPHCTLYDTVYFMDAQIWYAIFSTLVGGIYGACRRLGEIRTLGMLRSRFQSLPGAFNARLVPVEKPDEKQKKGLKGFFAPQICSARFAQMWNKIITSFRKEDLISNREMELLLVPYVADRALDLIQWPPFLLASKLPIALDMAKDSNCKDRELRKRLEADSYMDCAVRECYASFKNIIKYLVEGEQEKKVINIIFDEVDSCIEDGKLISDVNMRALPALYDQFVKLIQYL